MSSRRSGRAKAPVKYTSASENSDLEDKKPKKAVSKKSAPKKRSKAEQDPSADGEDKPKKRSKKSPETLAVEHTEKAAAQQEKVDKAAHKRAWDDWVKENDGDAELLDEEPGKEESITQTDSLKKYGLKATELGSLKHFEKRNPVYNNTMKLFLEEDVKVLGFRKHGMLAGETEEKGILEKGEQVWKEEHKDDDGDDDDAKNTTDKPDTKAKKPPKAKTPKQIWTAYIESHSLSEHDALKDEPEDAINQSDCKAKYKLVPGDLAVLPYFPKPNQKYGQTAKLFKESEVKTLAYRKVAVLDGVDESDDVALLEKGKELFEGTE